MTRSSSESSTPNRSSPCCGKIIEAFSALCNEKEVVILSGAKNPRILSEVPRSLSSGQPKRKLEHSMKILYVAGLSPKESSLYRLCALERLGHDIVPFNTFDYLPRSPLIRKVTHRLSAGPSVNRLNHDLLRIAEAEQPDLFWAANLL